MSVWQAFLLGAVQGATEFLPISSSGHLILARMLVGINETSQDATFFDVSIHIGTLIASMAIVMPVLKDMVAQILKFRWIKSAPSSTVFKVFIATLPALATGVLVSLCDAYGETVRTATVTAIALIAGGAIFLFFPGSKHSLPDKTPKLPPSKKVFLMGVSQILAFIPGVSRSGSTLVAGRLLNLSFESAIKTSFVLSLPLTAIAGAWGLVGEQTNSSLGLALDSNNLRIALVGIVTSFVFGLISGKLLLGKLPRIGLIPFGIYRIFIGIFILVAFGF